MGGDSGIREIGIFKLPDNTVFIRGNQLKPFAKIVSLCSYPRLTRNRFVSILFICSSKGIELFEHSNFEFSADRMVFFFKFFKGTTARQNISCT